MKGTERREKTPQKYISGNGLACHQVTVLQWRAKAAYSWLFFSTITVHTVSPATEYRCQCSRRVRLMWNGNNGRLYK